jgi:toxin ParE1/3/4
MSRLVIMLPRAETDFIGCYAHLALERSPETADRFLYAVEQSLALFARAPEIGAPHQTNNPQLAGLRSLPVLRFKRFIIFYRALDDRVELVRLLHGAGDIGRILGADRDDGE